jgi:DNA helicase-4
MFLRIFGDTIQHIEDEDRRLFYVALTRAKNALVVLTDCLKSSPFLDDIGRHGHQGILTHLRWNELPPMRGLDGARLEMHVSQAREVMDQLCKDGFKFDGAKQCWRLSIPAEGFLFDHWLQKPWATPKVHIDVYTEDGQLLCTNHTYYAF